MIILVKSSSNDMYVVCDDVLTLADPIYLWRFYNEQTKEQYLIELANNQEANNRFDMFTLVLPTDLNLDTGVYSWEIYQSPLTGDEDYSAMLMLSNGTARVDATFNTNTSYEPSGTDTVYQG